MIFVHEGTGTLRDDVRRRAVQGGRLHRRPARDDVPLRPRRRAALPRLRDAGPDRDPAALSQPVRADRRGRAVLPPRHPSADRAAHACASRASSRSRCACAAATRRTSSTTTRSTSSAGTATSIPWTFSMHDFEPITGPHPPAAAVAPDVRGPELRDLLVLPAQARLRPAGGADPVPPLESAVGGDDLLRLRQLRLAQAASRSARSRCIRPVCRTARSPVSPRRHRHRTRRTSSP